MRRFFATLMVITLCFGGIQSLHGFWPNVDDEGVVTLVGTGSHGVYGGGLAQFNLPFGLTGGLEGEIIVADTFNNVLRRVTPQGEANIFAGYVQVTGADSFPIGFYYDSVLLDSGFNRPADIAVDANGRIFIADSHNHAIRVIIDGSVFTFAGGNGAGYAGGGADVTMFNMPGAIAVCPDGNVYVADTGNHAIRRITPGGITSTVAGRGGVFGYASGRSALFDSPQGIAISDDGRIFVADTGNNTIRVIDGGETSTLAGSSISVTFDVYGDGWDSAPIGLYADNFGINALFNQPIGLAFWGEYLLVADSANHAIRVISPTSEVRTLLGSTDPGYYSVDAHTALFHFPMGLYVQGNRLFIADSANNMIRTVTLF